MFYKFFWPFAITSLIFILLVIFIIHSMLSRQRERFETESKKNRMKELHTTALLHAKLEEQEKTIEIISRDIHDHFGQIINLIKMNVLVVKDLATMHSQVSLIQNVNHLLDGLIENVQHLSRSMNKDYFQGRGLLEMVKTELNFINCAGKIKAGLRITGMPESLSSESELMIYRIFQEALSNTIRYANASLVDVRLIFGDKEFEMEIRDNGSGFNSSQLLEFKGLGFINMTHRAKLLRGSLKIISSPGRGCRTFLSVPYQKTGLNERWKGD